MYKIQLHTKKPWTKIMKTKYKQELMSTRFKGWRAFLAYFLICNHLVFCSFAYAGKGSIQDLVDDGLSGSNVKITSTLKHQDKVFQEEVDSSGITNTGTASSSLFSFFRSAASNTLSWMNECALSGCDRFGKWIGSYAKDLPPTYFAKSLLEVDYAHDTLFWQGHFNQEIKDLKRVRSPGVQEQTRLRETQELVLSGLLSPYEYEEVLKTLEKKKSFSSLVQDIKNALHSEIKENPEAMVQHLRKDLLASIEDMQNNGEITHKTLITDFKKKLIYYKNVMNAFDYAETLARLFLGMEQNKEKLALSEIQYMDFVESLTNVLHKTDKQHYFQIKEEREAILASQKTSIQENKETAKETEIGVGKVGNLGGVSSIQEEDNHPPTYFSYPVSFVKGAASFVKRGVNFALENPTQFITMGLAFQAAAVAAKSSFSLPPQFEITKGSRITNSAIAPLKNGNALVVWDDREEGASASKIFGRVLNPVGTPVTSTFRIDSTMGFSPSVATTFMNGNVFVAWEQSLDNFNKHVINGRIIDPLGNPVTNQFRVSNDTFSDSYWPSVSTLSNGNIFLAYGGYNYSPREVDTLSMRVMNSSGVPATNESQMSISKGLGAIIPSVTVLGKKNAAFVTYNTDDDIYGIVLDNKANYLTKKFRINNSTIRAYPCSATLSNGNVLVGWSANPINELNGRIMDAKGNPVTNQFLINDIESDSQYSSLDITSLRSGNAFLVWSQFNSSNREFPEVYGRVINPLGKPVTNKFRINDGDMKVWQVVTSTLNNGQVFVSWRVTNSILYGRIFRVD